jgi:ketosteroid isomerase-like protein
MSADYDSFEESRAVIEKLFRLAEPELAALPGSEELDELRRRGESLFADDVEVVTRDGTLRGPWRIFDDFEVQLKSFTLSFELRHLFEAADGSVVAVVKFMRRSRENPKDHFWNLGGMVYGVRDGKIVFSEGYPNARKALEAVGLDPALA